MFYFILNRGTLTKEIRILIEEIGNFLENAQIFFKEFGEKMKSKNEILEKIRKKNNE